MADLKTIINCAKYGLFGASLAVWIFILWKASRGRPVLALQPQEPVSWPSLPVGATFLVAYTLPLLLVGLVAPGDMLRGVQARCGALVIQGLVVVGLLSRAGPLRKEDFGCESLRWRGDLLAGVAGFFASLIPVFVVAAALKNAGWRGPDDKHQFFKILDSDSGNTILAWIALSVVVAAPLAEELMYRVLLLGWTKSQITPWKAILFSAAVFTLAHGEHDWLPLFPLALILGYVYHKRHSYLAVVVLHALFNATNVAMAVLANQESKVPG